MNDATLLEQIADRTREAAVKQLTKRWSLCAEELLDTAMTIQTFADRLKRLLPVPKPDAGETPETDAESAKLGPLYLWATPTDFARRLERERNQARSQMARYRADFEIDSARADQLYKEREAALAEVAELKRQLHAAEYKDFPQAVKEAARQKQP